jgi:flagellar hook protein FlgE
MSSGFSIGLNALQANSAAIEVASKNIAASNVSGYKSTEYLFQEALTRSLQPSASGRFGTVGTSGVSRRNYASGSAKYSASPLDLSITGDGFFTVGLFKEPSSEKTFFTRSGQFLTDKDGFIVSSSGLFLYGYQPTTDGTNINPNITGPLKEPSSPMPPSRTKAALVSVNLDSRLSIVPEKIKQGQEDVSNFIDPENPGTYSHVQQFPLFDKLGQQHSVSLYFRRASKRVYDIYVNVDGQIFGINDATKTTEPSVIEMPKKISDPPVEGDIQDKAAIKPVARFQFFEGKLVNISNSEGSIADVESALDTRSAQATGDNLKLFFKIKPPPSASEPRNPALVFSDEIEFSLDFSGTTSFASSFEVKNVTQDGYAAGSLSGLSTDDKGIVRGQFSNGRSVVAGQVLLATFKGLGGLREVSNNTFQSTPQSGDPIFGKPTEQSLGSIRSNSVEEANTDMAGELVRLMVQQRNYQANAQSIRTQVEILSVTIDVTR